MKERIELMRGIFRIKTGAGKGDKDRNSITGLRGRKSVEIKLLLVRSSYRSKGTRILFEDERRI